MKILAVYTLLLFSIILQSCTNSGSNTVSVNELEGRWKFVGVERKVENNWITDRWMQNGTGYLIYNNKGHMALHITPHGYSETNIIWHQDSLTFGSWPIFELMIEESGRYTLSNHVFTGNYLVSGDTLIHDWLTHSNPSNFGRRIVRKYLLDSDTLDIFPPIPNPTLRVRYFRDN